MNEVYNSIKEHSIISNLGKLPILKGLLQEEHWIIKTLKRSPFISILYWLSDTFPHPLLQQLERNLSDIGIDEIENKQKNRIVNKLKSKNQNDIFEVLSETEIYAHFKRNNILCVYQPMIRGYAKKVDFLIKIDKEDIFVEVTVKNWSDKFKFFFKELYINKVRPPSAINEEIGKRLFKILEKETEQLKNTNKNIIIINHPYADEWHLKNAVYGYIRDEESLQYQVSRRVNLIVGYKYSINNSSLYFNENPHIPFTQKEKEIISQIFSKAI